MKNARPPRRATPLSAASHRRPPRFPRPAAGQGLDRVPLPQRVLRGFFAIALALGLAPLPQIANAEPALGEAADTAGSEAQTSSSAIDALVENLALPEGASLSDIADTEMEAGIDQSYRNLGFNEVNALAELPEHYDLRTDSGIEGGAVTPVKFQNPWGTCWAFSALSSIESALILQGRGTASDTDLSERHMAWFAYTPPDETSAEAMGASGQGGEGIVPVEEGQAALFNLGGVSLCAAQCLTSAQDPVSESAAPYRNDEGILREEKDDQGAITYQHYLPDGTWSLDEAYRLTSEETCQISGVYQLPLPMQETSPEDDTLIYQESATVAIKQAVMEHGAVDMFYHADMSRPDEQGSGTYFNYHTWAQYTYEYAEDGSTPPTTS